MLRAKGCSSRIMFLRVRKKARDWVGLNAIVDVKVLLVCGDDIDDQIDR